jgi:hypothetical protein
VAGSALRVEPVRATACTIARTDPEWGHCFPLPRDLGVASPQDPTLLDAGSTLRTVDQLGYQAAAALSELVASLICGEESAVQVFHNEERRLNALALQRSQTLLAAIASEEQQHQALLNHWAAYLPHNDATVHRRRSARRFFLSLECREPGRHFARIAALDANVCRIMATLSRPGTRMARLPTLTALCRRILTDEAKHVHVSRQHALALGVTRAELHEQASLVDHGLLELIDSLGPAFEVLEVDLDRLRGRISHDRDHDSTRR